MTIIDGTGAPPRAAMRLVLKGERIDSIGCTCEPLPPNATVVDLHGSYVMPELVDVHVHLGLLSGLTISAANYTEANIASHLRRFQSYGIGAVISLGSDRDEILAVRSATRVTSSPLVYSALQGFGVPNGLPPLELGFDQAYRPATADEARSNVDAVALKGPDIIKIWVDDFWGKYPKMKPEIYGAIIEQAHSRGLKVAAHVYHLEDARSLVIIGVDVLAHSVRDGELDPDLLARMKANGTVYVPTLSLDEYAFAYPDESPWLRDPFFVGALEPGVLQMVTSAEYRTKLKADPTTAAERKALPIALKNVASAYKAGVKVALGTDAGATPIRPQGYSEHHELGLLVEAGLSPLEAITIGTKNGADLLNSHDFGTLEVGKHASFIVLDNDPTVDIANTHTISTVWHRGTCVFRATK
ncbi:MAG: amidohydrolase family protein [Clostridia bacterium]|nr:amidohydrolase family protein [Deltaproteobacteria bacterium]